MIGCSNTEGFDIYSNIELASALHIRYRMNAQQDLFGCRDMDSIPDHIERLEVALRGVFAVGSHIETLLATMQCSLTA